MEALAESVHAADQASVALKEGRREGLPGWCPLLRRLEAQGLLESEWRVEGSRPRRYYITSKSGWMLLKELHSEWNDLVAILREMMPEVD